LQLRLSQTWFDFEGRSETQQVLGLLIQGMGYKHNNGIAFCFKVYASRFIHEKPNVLMSVNCDLHILLTGQAWDAAVAA